jgi:hypothetical protein
VSAEDDKLNAAFYDGITWSTMLDIDLAKLPESCDVDHMQGCTCPHCEVFRKYDEPRAWPAPLTVAALVVVEIDIGVPQVCEHPACRQVSNGVVDCGDCGDCGERLVFNREKGMWLTPSEKRHCDIHPHTKKIGGDGAMFEIWTCDVCSARLCRWTFQTNAGTLHNLNHNKGCDCQWCKRFDEYETERSLKKHIDKFINESPPPVQDEAMAHTPKQLAEQSTLIKAPAAARIEVQHFGNEPVPKLLHCTFECEPTLAVGVGYVCKNCSHVLVRDYVMQKDGFAHVSGLANLARLNRQQEASVGTHAYFMQLLEEHAPVHMPVRDIIEKLAIGEGVIFGGYDDRANELADECQSLKDENRDLLVENARMRRQLERKR